ncbi:hypothetical protein ACIQXA_40060 [Streptomyces massasporeus]|uniref:hypothetical protein n=1 Tax=Streptomyces massasporeus TaxID=67324 RepID=UPI0037FC05AD
MGPQQEEAHPGLDRGPCPAFDASYGTAGFYKPVFTPAPYATRVNPHPPDGLDRPALSGHQKKEQPAALGGHRALSCRRAPT